MGQKVSRSSRRGLQGEEAGGPGERAATAVGSSVARP